MRKLLSALLFGFSAATCAFTSENAERVDSLCTTYRAPYSLKVNGLAMEIQFAENKKVLSMILSDRAGNVLFSKDTVVLDHMNSISIPLADTGNPMTLDIRCAAYTGKSFIPGYKK